MVNEGLSRKAGHSNSNITRSSRPMPAPVSTKPAEWVDFNPDEVLESGQARVA
jgi:hypothetical protein